MTHKPDVISLYFIVKEWQEAKIAWKTWLKMSKNDSSRTMGGIETVKQRIQLQQHVYKENGRFPRKDSLFVTSIYLQFFV
jgi:hypothetical protein